ncbi:M3 family oligoendopeptidase [Candidatus Woesearchaeota archaeon]|nr:M3 family oligoendopeptidase [Candidatus Woesearchaeota archaeon]
MYKTGPWNLNEIKPKDLDLALKEIQETVSKLVKRRKELTDKISPSLFMQWVKEIESMKIDINKLSAYISLKFAEDSSDQLATANLSKVENELTKINNQLLFFGLWFKDLPEHKAKELIKHSKEYSYHFEQLRAVKPYALNEKEEQIINIKDLTGVSALNNVYRLLTGQFEYKYRGKTLTQEEVIVIVRDPNPEVRKKAYLLLLEKYKSHKDVIGEIYKNIINDWREESIHLRGYKSPINVRNIANDIPGEAVEVLLKVCEKNQHLFHHFFELKQKNLGLKKMTRFDLYSPIKKKKEEKIDYNEALNLVLEVFEKFSPKFKEGALEIINQNHVHSEVKKNKQSGAFCMSVHAKLPPYVLWSYTGTLRDVSTIAHELGHGIHHILSRENTEYTFHSSLPLAETASVFSEMILSEKVAEKYPQKAKELLYYKIDDIYATIIRQAGFVAFEKKAHEMMKEGKTIDEMSAVYLEMLKNQLGPKVEIDPIFAYEWCYIPHIFSSPFYCYAYAFGNLLTLALYEMYKEKGHHFVPKIIEMLAKGGSASPVDITKAVGIDICSEAFWQKGFDVIKGMIKKLE